MTDRDDSRSGRRGPGLAVAAVLALALGIPATARANPPRITEEPAVNGTPQVGETLSASGAGAGNPTPTSTWQWFRCGGAGLGSCREIAGSTATVYTVTEADLHMRLRVRLVVTNEDGSARAISAGTAAVAAAPPPPPPPPDPEPEPQPEPEPVVTPAPVAAAVPAAPAPVVEVLEEQASAPRRMRPAPVVRIRGRLTRTGALITLLTVRSPRGARITALCGGPACPARRRWSGTAADGTTRIARFQRALSAGTKLVITVTQPGRIGKHTTILIRRGTAPARRDRCLMPGARKPVRCPG